MHVPQVHKHALPPMLGVTCNGMMWVVDTPATHGIIMVGRKLCTVKEATRCRIPGVYPKTHHYYTEKVLPGTGRTMVGFPRCVWMYMDGMRQPTTIGWPPCLAPEALRYVPPGGGLLPYQVTCVDKACVSLGAYGSAFLVVPCGMGKTEIGAALVGKLQACTWWVVPNCKLMTQIQKKLCARFPDARVVGIDGTTPTIGTGRVPDIVVVVSASLRNILEDPDRRRSTRVASCTLMIMDESHHVAAESLFSICSNMCCSKTMFMTATPDRADALDKVFPYMCGPITYTVQRPPIDITATRVHTGPGGAGVGILYAVVEAVRCSRGRTIVLVDNVSDVLALYTAVTGTTVLGTLCEKEYRKRAPTVGVPADSARLRELRDTGATHGLMVRSEGVWGKVNSPHTVETCTVLWATTSSCGEGLDQQGVSTIVLATRRENTRQCRGRNVRCMDVAAGSMRLGWYFIHQGDPHEGRQWHHTLADRVGEFPLMATSRVSVTDTTVKILEGGQKNTAAVVVGGTPQFVAPQEAGVVAAAV